jgi:hypothetical protein
VSRGSGVDRPAGSSSGRYLGVNHSIRRTSALYARPIESSLFEQQELGARRGWRTALVFARTQRAGHHYLRSSEAHNRAMAVACAARLGFVSDEHLNDVRVGAALYPAADEMFIGAYSNGTVLTNPQLPLSLFNVRVRLGSLVSPVDLHSVRFELLNLAFEGDVLAMVLHSQRNLWAYALYANGALQRTAAAVGASGGILANAGALLPAERQVLRSRSLLAAHLDGDGELLVQEVVREFCGHTVTDLLELDLMMTRFGRRRPDTGRSLLHKATRWLTA